jgi:hypothetical protein
MYTNDRKLTGSECRLGEKFHWLRIESPGYAGSRNSCVDNAFMIELTGSSEAKKPLYQDTTACQIDKSSNTLSQVYENTDKSDNLDIQPICGPISNLRRHDRMAKEIAWL